MNKECKNRAPNRDFFYFLFNYTLFSMDINLVKLYKHIISLFFLKEFACQFELLIYFHIFIF